MKRILMIAFMLLATVFSARAQKVSIGTNALDWAYLGTVNAEASISVSQHFSLLAGGRYNDWEFHTGEKDFLMMNAQKTAWAGVRYWPWYVYSGWWFGARAQYSDFYNTGVWRPAVNTGKGAGAGISAGYSFMLTSHFNLEAGAGIWGGRLWEHTLYDSPRLLRVRESGPMWFISPDYLSLSISYVF